MVKFILSLVFPVVVASSAIYAIHSLVTLVAVLQAFTTF